MDDLKALLAPAWVHTALGGVALLAVAWLVAWLVRHVLVRVMTTVSRRTAWHWDDALLKRGVFCRLAQVAPMLVLHRGSDGKWRLKTEMWNQAVPVTTTVTPHS